MRTLATVAGRALGVPAIALAQPSDPSGPTDNPGPGSNASVGSNAGGVPENPGDDARIKELVDRELAKVLNDRAAKEAAERAAQDNAAKEASSNTPSDITGSSGFMDTRLAFTVTNENLLVKPGETIPSVPGWRFGVPNSLGVLFFDNYDTRYSGFETLSHAVMYRDFHKGHFDAEAGFVIRINELSEKNLALSDDGSYIVLSNWKDPDHKEPTQHNQTKNPNTTNQNHHNNNKHQTKNSNPEYGRANSATPGMKIQY